MDSTHTSPTIDDLRVVSEMGAELARFLESAPVRAAITEARAGIYEHWTAGASPAIREEAHAEHRALTRLLETFYEIQQRGIVAREAIRLRSEEDGE